MAQHKLPQALSFVLLTMGMSAPHAAADTILVGTVTCISTAPSCSEATSGPVVWRVINFMNWLYTPYPGSNDIRDVSLQFGYQGGSLEWHWDSIPPAYGPGQFVETGPFDASLVSKLISLQLVATLSRTVFDPLVPNDRYLMFIADSANVSGTITSFPPTLDVYVHGQFVSKPIPEPATITLLGVGVVAAMTSLRKRRGLRPL